MTVITLITPMAAFAPYVADAGPYKISMWSTLLSGNVVRIEVSFVQSWLNTTPSISSRNEAPMLLR